jgi:acetyl-CoA carboxylase biotin carboxylase subunit
MIKSVLIANRGEIAVRIARTCREMGIRTVGVFSEADRHSAHLEAMDEAYPIGPAPAADSYLNQEKIISTAKRHKVEAIHPGYGFLAENAEFAQRVTDAGLIWIGPPAEAIAAMGSKTGARARMAAAGVPIITGSDGPLLSPRDAEVFAERVGYPIILKAVTGGGGKGMRVVQSPDQIWDAFDASKREAESAFGDGSVYAEKYISEPRHIEIQIVADSQGNVIHLGERECSLQRRQQKIVEECPSIAVSPELRAHMGETAVAAARACGYVNAGTVEMLLDAEGNYYFLEMNTRLQVEHAVTEEVTGLDMVRLQMMIAAGEPLPLTQEQVGWRGHAIEVRIYAEDIPNGFLPSTGKITRLRCAAGPGVREDSGMREGSEISRFYDPMIAKLIVHAETRQAAQQRMIRVLREFELAGVRSNISYCRFILESEAFTKGNFNTRSADSELLEGFLEEYTRPVADESLLAGAIAEALIKYAPMRTHGAADPDSIVEDTRWRMAGRTRAMRGN